MKNCAAIILAAGKGTRLSKTANKIFLDLAGKSLLQRSLENIARFKRLSSIILVISQKDKQKIKTLLLSFAVKIPVFLFWEAKRDSSLLFWECKNIKLCKKIWLKVVFLYKI